MLFIIYIIYVYTWTYFKMGTVLGWIWIGNLAALLYIQMFLMLWQGISDWPPGLARHVDKNPHCTTTISLYAVKLGALHEVCGEIFRSFNGRRWWMRVMLVRTDVTNMRFFHQQKGVEASSHQEHKPPKDSLLLNKTTQNRSESVKVKWDHRKLSRTTESHIRSTKIIQNSLKTTLES